ncbi:hypothetical protein VNO77_02313 [Canavalia gladiata]|uniref:Uncharacterized protein n=1 Tax=Canavalia gladiata TaxID=3824 RepID=A0AAN9MXQ1_CANGL
MDGSSSCYTLVPPFVLSIPPCFEISSLTLPPSLILKTLFSLNATLVLDERLEHHRLQSIQAHVAQAQSSHSSWGPSSQGRGSSYGYDAFWDSHRDSPGHR